MVYVRTPLVEDRPLYSFDGDPGAFVELFQSVWARIPVEFTRSITDIFQPFSVRFLLSNDCVRKFGPGQVKTDLSGIEVWFWADAFTWLPKNAADWVIAHELAHVYQKCPGAPSSPDYDKNERIADELARGWGFSDTECLHIRMLRETRSLSWREASLEHRNCPACNRPRA